MPQTIIDGSNISEIDCSIGLFDNKENEVQTITSLNDTYEILKELGRGRFAKVVHVRCRATGEEAAAKLQRWRRSCGFGGGRSMKTLVDTEVSVLRLVRGHRGFVQLLACLSTQLESVILLEACTGGSLQDSAAGLSDTERAAPAHLDFCRRLALRLFSGLAHLHAGRICHLDVKPCNLLLRAPYPAGDICLCDFGLARMLGDNPAENVTLDGTPDYAAPEVLAYEPFTTAADLWSTGAVLFFTATGVSPFAASVAEPKEVVYSRVATIGCDWSLLAGLACEPLVRRLLVRLPGQRPKAEEAARDEFASVAEAD